MSNFFYILILFVFMVQVNQCQNKESADLELVHSVDVIVLKPEELTRNVRQGATVSYIEKSAVSAPMQGTLESIFVHEGDFVDQGQILAQLNTLELELAVKRALANEAAVKSQWQLSQTQYEQAKKESERYMDGLETVRANLVESRARFLNSKNNLENKREIFMLGGVSEVEMKRVYADYVSSMSGYYQAKKTLENRTIGYRKKDLIEAGFEVPADIENQKDALIRMNTEADKKRSASAESSYKSAVIERRAAQQMLAEATIRSPIQGVVASRSKEPGEEVKPGESFLTVVYTKELLITTVVPELDFPHIRKGQLVEITADVYKGITFQGEVHRISPIIDPQTRTFQVGVKVHNDENHILAPGMFVRVNIQTAKKSQAVSIPLAALIPETAEALKAEDLIPGSERRVFVARNGHAFSVPVVIGEVFGNQLHIESGLEFGETLIVSDPRLLQDNMMVKINTKDMANDQE